MKKIVINKCYGGFGLSEAAVLLYAEIKGITLYVEGKGSLRTYFLVPKEERVKELPKPWIENSLEDRCAYNEEYTKQVFYDCYIKRDDPVLIQVVEHLRDKANGYAAKLKIVEIPDDIEYTIEEYDGVEHIAEKHRTWN
jgi:hypothetical protein